MEIRGKFGAGAVAEGGERSGAGAPAELVAGFVAAVCAGDVDAIVRSYAADAVLGLPGGREAAGVDRIRAAFVAALAGGGDLGIGPAPVAPESVGVVVAGGLALTSFVGGDGRLRSVVLREEPSGSWRILTDGSTLAVQDFNEFVQGSSEDLAG